jgi:hypothetical protein
MSFNFLTEFFKYFFRVLHEASSSWLKFVHAFQKHPVYYLKRNTSTFVKYQHDQPTFKIHYLVINCCLMIINLDDSFLRK